MLPRRSRIICAIGLVVVLALGLLSWRSASQAWAVMQMRNTIDGTVTVSHDLPSGGFRWRLREWMQRELDRVVSHELLRLRCREGMDLIMGAPIREIDITIDSFRGDPGAFLARFPHLEDVTITVSGHSKVHEARVEELCRHLRDLPQLRSLKLMGDEMADAVADASIAPLAGHPRLQRFVVGGALSIRTKETLVSLPSLTELHLYSQRLGTAEIVVILSALPSVTHFESQSY